MKAFVSGVAGFLGAHIAREGLALGWEVTGADSLIAGEIAASRSFAERRIQFSNCRQR